MTNIEKRASFIAIRYTQHITSEEMLEVGRKQRSLTIGIPLDTDKSENRVSLTPQGVELLVENGHKVVIESGAGERANYFDRDFAEAGAIVASGKDEVFRSDIILKISPPTEEEIEMMTNDQVILSYLQFSKQTRESIVKMMNRRINAVAYEFMRDNEGCYPVIQSMSEIEGYAAISIASEYLSKAHGGKGVLLGGITGVSPTEVVIIGAGTAGEFAARAALGLGCQIKVFDNSYQNLRELERNLGQRVFTSVLHPHVLTKALKSADAVVASLRYFENDTAFYITCEQIEQMKPGSVIVDLSIGDGRCFESMAASSHDPDKPFINKNGVIHYMTPNVASRVSRTASIALSNIIAPIILKMANAGGIHQLVKEDLGVSNGTYLYKGILTNQYIGNSLGLPSKDIGLLLAAF
jgi:alanine dehydrogenase